MSLVSRVLSCRLPHFQYLSVSFPKFYSAKDVHEEVPTSSENVKKILDNSSPLKYEDVENYEWATTPYPKGTVFNKCDQARHSLRPKRDPETTSIIMFPGQGIQHVGMGRDLLKYPVVPDLFKSASDILGYDLLKLCLNGPIEKLSRTEYAQPAILVCSLAAVEKLKDERPSAIDNCIATAGFSLGELSALVFAGALSFERGIQLVRVRAEAMQLASEIIPGGMMTVLFGADSTLGQACEEAKEHCRKLGIEQPECGISNYLYPHCKIIAGNLEALKYIENNTRKHKLRKLSRLPVSGAFHTPLMRPASEPFRKALEKANIKDPIISVHSNIDGKRYQDANEVLHKLPKQIYKPVKWEQTLHILYSRDAEEKFPKTYECGPGSLKTILYKVNSKAAASCYVVGS